MKKVEGEIERVIWSVEIKGQATGGNFILCW